MNRLGGKSNTGEGGEESETTRSRTRRAALAAIKQVASGRFGVTSPTSSTPTTSRSRWRRARSPARAASCPSHKVYPWIAKDRHSTPASASSAAAAPRHLLHRGPRPAHPRPEERNPRRGHVKLVAEVGVGTVAAGVAKAHADVVLISGTTGHRRLAAHLDQARRAAWGLGPAETQQTLCSTTCGPRGRRGRRPAEDGPRRGRRRAARRRGVRLRHGPLVVDGLRDDARLPPDTCPVGVATQTRCSAGVQRQAGVRREVLHLLAEEVREHRGAGLPLGRGDGRPRRGARHHRAAAALPEGRGPRPVADPARAPLPAALASHETQDHGSTRARQHSSRSPPTPSSAASRVRSPAPHPQRQPHRRHDARLGGQPPPRRRRACRGTTTSATFTGSAGQSFGAFLPRGITLGWRRRNDYVGKGLSGGRVVVRPDRAATFVAGGRNVIAGNVVGYGDRRRDLRPRRRGRAVLRAQLRRDRGRRGVGDHGCEYMTGGRVSSSARPAQLRGRHVGGRLPRRGAFRVNTEMVDLVPLDDDDVAVLRPDLPPQEETGSAVAAAVLASGDDLAARFTRSCPRLRPCPGRPAAADAGRDVRSP